VLRGVFGAAKGQQVLAVAIIMKITVISFLCRLGQKLSELQGT